MSILGITNFAKDADGKLFLTAEQKQRLTDKYGEQFVNGFAADLAKMQDEVPEGVRGHYLDLEAHAGDCTGCRACESRCPFGVAIADRMEETAALFGL